MNGTRGTIDGRSKDRDLIRVLRDGRSSSECYHHTFWEKATCDGLIAAAVAHLSIVSPTILGAAAERELRAMYDAGRAREREISMEREERLDANCRALIKEALRSVGEEVAGG